MTELNRGAIEDDNAQMANLSRQIALASRLPQGSEPHRLAHALRQLPSLPDRFNAAFVEHGWVFVEFACGYESAERALDMLHEGAPQAEIDAYLSEELIGIEPVKWQSLKIFGGGMVDPEHPVRAAVVERVFEAYEARDHLVVVPLVLMLVDGFGVSVTGTKSMFADLDTLDELFQSSESVAGHPSALKALLVHLRRGQRGYSESMLTMPLRNGILHGTRLNYANPVTAAKAMNLLAAVVEWARDVAPEPKNEVAKREWNAKFLESNLSRLNPDTPQRAFDLVTAALSAQRATDLVALINYHPALTLLSEKIQEWREVISIGITIEPLTPWEVFGTAADSEQHARRNARLVIVPQVGEPIIGEHVLRASRSVELSRAGLPSVWQLDLGLLGAIRHLLATAVDRETD